MERFDEEECLCLIEKHRVTHSQFVPTMFSRMLNCRKRAPQRLSSLEAVVHGPRPVRFRSRGR